MSQQPLRLTLFSLLLFTAPAYYLLSATPHAHADAASDLRAQINAHNEQIAQLNADIAAYQKQLDALGTKKNTLQSTIGSLSLEAKQLASQIQISRNKIASANLQIQQITLSIGDKEAVISTEQAAIAKALRSIAEGEETPLVAQLIASNSLSDAWGAADEAVQFNRALAHHIQDLKATKIALASNRDQVAAAKNSLVSLNNELTTQKSSVDANTSTQKQLLAQTKNQETSYQKLLAEKKSAEKVFEQQLINLQSQLNLIVNPGSLPAVGSGILVWPFTPAFMQGCGRLKGALGNPYCITQYFGNTSFSTANPQIYKGKGHNAIDMGAPVGTPIVAALSGTVLATGNTDLSHSPTGAQCYSFGKWIMVKHNNGLSTMYAHLSKIDVSPGQGVTTSQVIGLSGMSGYATGPHIHFGVYATEGTKIMDLGAHLNTTNGPCSRAVMPVATLDAYLNPLSYL